MPENRVGLVGLGRMGAAMAGRLSDRGFKVIGCDVSDSARRNMQDAVDTTDSVDDIVKLADWIMLSLPTSREVESVLQGPNGLLARLADGACVIDTSSSDPNSTRRLAAVARRAGIAFVDAPVSGGPAGAAAGTLAVAVGGAAHEVSMARPPLEALAAKIVHVGDSGAGHVTKIVNNLLCAAHLLIDGAGVRLAQRAGLDPRRLLDAINASSGRSAVTESFMPKWVLPGTFDSGFTMSLMCKDLRLAQAMLSGAPAEAQLCEIIDVWEAELLRLGADTDFTRMAELAETASAKE